MTQPIVQHFFDEPTNTFSYVVRDPDSQACAILDSALDFDYAAGRTDVRSADEIIQYVRDTTCGLSGFWKPTCTRTTCQPHPICTKSWVARPVLAQKSSTFRKSLARPLMPGPNLHAMAASSTSCLRKAIPSPLATSKAMCCTLRATHRRA